MIGRGPALGLVLGASLVACTESSVQPAGGAGGQFASMRAPCTAQAARFATPVEILDEIQTGGGPILTLMAGGTRYTCRREPDGSVTVFSEYAN